MQPHLDAADACLADLALSVPVAQVRAPVLPVQCPLAHLTVILLHLAQYYSCVHAELEHVLDLSQGMRSGSGNLRCWVDADLAPAAPGAPRCIDLVVHLRNVGPHPLTQAWSALIACRSDSPGGRRRPHPHVPTTYDALVYVHCLGHIKVLKCCCFLAVRSTLVPNDLTFLAWLRGGLQGGP